MNVDSSITSLSLRGKNRKALATSQLNYTQDSSAVADVSASFNGSTTRTKRLLRRFLRSPPLVPSSTSKTIFNHSKTFRKQSPMSNQSSPTYSTKNLTVGDLGPLKPSSSHYGFETLNLSLQSTTMFGRKESSASSQNLPGSPTASTNDVAHLREKERALTAQLDLFQRQGVYFVQLIEQVKLQLASETLVSLKKLQPPDLESLYIVDCFLKLVGHPTIETKKCFRTPESVFSEIRQKFETFDVHSNSDQLRNQSSTMFQLRMKYKDVLSREDDFTGFRTNQLLPPKAKTEPASPAMDGQNTALDLILKWVLLVLEFVNKQEFQRIQRIRLTEVQNRLSDLPKIDDKVDDLIATTPVHQHRGKRKDKLSKRSAGEPGRKRLGKAKSNNEQSGASTSFLNTTGGQIPRAPGGNLRDKKNLMERRSAERQSQQVIQNHLLLALTDTHNTPVKTAVSQHHMTQYNTKLTSEFNTCAPSNQARDGSIRCATNQLGKTNWTSTSNTPDGYQTTTHATSAEKLAMGAGNSEEKDHKRVPQVSKAITSHQFKFNEQITIQDLDTDPTPPTTSSQNVLIIKQKFAPVRSSRAGSSQGSYGQGKSFCDAQRTRRSPQYSNLQQNHIYIQNCIDQVKKAKSKSPEPYKRNAKAYQSFNSTDIHCFQSQTMNILLPRSNDANFSTQINSTESVQLVVKEARNVSPLGKNAELWQDSPFSVEPQIDILQGSFLNETIHTQGRVGDTSEVIEFDYNNLPETVIDTMAYQDQDEDCENVQDSDCEDETSDGAISSQRSNKVKLFETQRVLPVDTGFGEQGMPKSLKDRNSPHIAILNQLDGNLQIKFEKSNAHTLSGASPSLGSYFMQSLCATDNSCESTDGIQRTMLNRRDLCN